MEKFWCRWSRREGKDRSFIDSKLCSGDVSTDLTAMTLALCANSLDQVQR